MRTRIISGLTFMTVCCIGWGLIYLIYRLVVMVGPAICDFMDRFHSTHPVIFYVTALMAGTFMFGFVTEWTSQARRSIEEIRSKSQ